MIHSSKINRQRHLSRRFSLFLCCLILLLFSLGLTACQGNEPENNAATEETVIKSNASFQKFLDRAFAKLAGTDAITLHLHLENPKKYGLNKKNYTKLPSPDSKAQAKIHEEEKTLLEELITFNKEELSPDEQLTYDLLEDSLTLSLEMDRKYPFYKSNLGANGAFLQIMVTLSQYNFTDEDDLTIYLDLLKQLPDYLNQLLDYEIDRQAAGFTPSDTLMYDTIYEMKAIIDCPLDQNILITSFGDRIQNMKKLSKKKQKIYSRKNEKLVKETVLPAYKKTRKAIKRDLFPSDEMERLAQLKNGVEYYQLLLKETAGTDLTVKECEQALNAMLKNVMKDSRELFNEDPDLQEEWVTALPECGNAEKTLKQLSAYTQEDFPALDVGFHLKDVPEMLNSTSASAFYLLPAFDSKEKNVIFFNKVRMSDQEIFSTLAHEGYPGHLYQTSYFHKTLSHPIRTLLRNNGYDEGWGTYAQLFYGNRLHFKNLSEDHQEYMQCLYRNNDLFSLILCSLADIYVNEKNYSLADLKDWMGHYGISPENAEDIYHFVIEQPASYLSYSMGYYELMQLRDQAENELETYSEDFLLDFHKKILDLGSCPFYILKRYFIMK